MAQTILANGAAGALGAIAFVLLVRTTQDWWVVFSLSVIIGIGVGLVVTI